jgi:hypothetical protein
MRAPKIHYVHPSDVEPESETFCGLPTHDPSTVTVWHLDVTCKNCKRAIAAAFAKDRLGDCT